MSFSTRVGLLAGATALTLTGVSSAAPATQGNDEMAQRLAAAEAKIAQLEAANNQDWLTEQRASEIKGLVQDVLADADSRASLLQAGATSGYDNGFIIGSTDGNWLLRTNFLMQQRFIWDHRDNSSDDDRSGFENTRSKFILTGHVVNPDWFYRVDVNVGSPSGASFGDGRSGTLNAYLGYNYGNGWSIMMGSMKAPLLREELVESQYQLAVERSNVNYLFTGGYVDGLAVTWASDQFRVTGMISDGARTGQTMWAAFDTEYAFTGRAEFLASGTWDQFKDFTSPQGGETGIMVGAAAHYQKGEFGSPGLEPEVLILTGDVSAEFGGFNLYGAIVWTDLQDFLGVSGLDINPWGFVVQGGFYLNDTWELFGRYEYTDYDAPTGFSVDEMSVATIGVNKYFSGHNAKWTTDVGYSFNSLGDPIGASPALITGYQPDATNEDGQIVVRTQVQILF